MRTMSARRRQTVRDPRQDVVPEIHNAKLFTASLSIKSTIMSYHAKEPMKICHSISNINITDRALRSRGGGGVSL